MPISFERERPGYRSELLRIKSMSHFVSEKQPAAETQSYARLAFLSSIAGRQSFASMLVGEFVICKGRRVELSIEKAPMLSFFARISEPGSNGALKKWRRREERWNKPIKEMGMAKKSSAQMLHRKRLRAMGMAEAEVENAQLELRGEAMALRKNIATTLKTVINQAGYWVEEENPEQRFANFVGCVFAFGQAASIACPEHTREVWEATCGVASRAAADDAILGELLGAFVSCGRNNLVTKGKVRLTATLMGWGGYSEERRAGTASGISGHWMFGGSPKVGSGEDFNAWIRSACGIVALGMSEFDGQEMKVLCYARKGPCSWPRPAEPLNSKMSGAEVAAMAWLGEILPMLHGEVGRLDGLAVMRSAAEKLQQAALQVERPGEAADGVDRLVAVCKEGAGLLERELKSSGRASEWIELRDALAGSRAASWAVDASVDCGQKEAKGQIIFDAIFAALEPGLIPVSASAIEGIRGPLSEARVKLFALSEAAELRGSGGAAPHPRRQSLRM